MWGERCFAVYGEYNTNLDDANYNQTSIYARTTHQLAILCLEAMGEVGYSLGMLPNLPGPPVQWDGNDPAIELQNLCSAYGCLVTLTPQDRVYIARDGFGRTPQPDSRQMDFTSSTEPPIIPAALVFEGGQSHIQHDLYLEPVAEEPNPSSPFYRKHVSIFDVSYYQDLRAGGGLWATEDPNRFDGVGITSGVPNKRLALRDVWRKYAVIARASGPIRLPIPPEEVTNRTNGQKLTPTQQSQLQDYFTINAYRGYRLLPWNKEQNQSSAIGSMNSKAAVIGYHWLGGAANANTSGYDQISSLPSVVFDASRNIFPYGNPGVGGITIPQQDYTIDFENGLVVFNEATFFKDVLSGYQPAMIRLRTSFPLRDPVSGAAVCSQWWRAPGSPIATNLAKLVKRSDVYLEYDGEGNDTAADFKSKADYFLAAELNTYSIGNGYSAPYKGFVVDIPIDGVVRTIAWDATPDSGGMTHIDYNMERPEAYLTLTEIHARRFATWNAFKAVDDRQKIARGIKRGP